MKSLLKFFAITSVVLFVSFLGKDLWGKFIYELNYEINRYGGLDYRFLIFIFGLVFLAFSVGWLRQKIKNISVLK